jgi:membrane protease YdiL (CAAX protease family)
MPQPLSEEPLTKASLRPLGSPRHTLILLLIIGAITLAGSGGPPSSAAGHKMLIYLTAIGGELLLIRYVMVGLKKTATPMSAVVSRRPIKFPSLAVDLALGGLFWYGARMAIQWVGSLLGPYSDHTSFLMAHTPAERVLWVVVACSAGFAEELVFRGYLQRQFAAWSGSRIVGVLAQALLFGAAHSYQGWRSTLVITFYGLLFGILAEVRGSLIPGMAAHAWTDIVGGLTGG